MPGHLEVTLGALHNTNPYPAASTLGFMKDDRVRIFISSPADVDHERAIVKDVIDRLSQEYLPYFPLQAILWEEEALTADRTFQAGLTQPAACDIVLLILWTRLGSPLPQEPYRGMTGTEWEFVNAADASVDSGIPEILVYKKTAPQLIDITDAGTAFEAVEDRRRLDEFFRSHFYNEDNTFRRAFRTFDDDAAFRELVEVQLRKLLNRRISAERRAVAGELTWHGSPFRPDRPFESSDERIFTGREREVWDLLARLEQCAATGYGLLLLSGPSGSGKTSLLRAGLVPRLSRPFQFEQVATVRCCLVDPRVDGPSPIQALADRLCAEDCLGDTLGRFGIVSEGLARLLISEPRAAARQIIAAASNQARRTNPNASARLALILDPLDMLFAAPEVDGNGPGGDRANDDALQAFATALHALALCEGVWVIAAMRSDALRHLPRLAPLIDRLGASALVTLEPPAHARLRQVVEIPARIAGIDFDTRDEVQSRSLVEMIEADAADLRLWPPPLQGALDAVYRAAAADTIEKTGEDVQVSARCYREQGGLKGQLIARAGQVWDGLDEHARAALPMLCRALISLENASGSKPAVRQGDLRVLERDPDCRRLLVALTEARLVITEGIRDASLLARCEPPDYRILSLVRSVWQQSREDWQARWMRIRDHVADAPLRSDPAPSGDEEDAVRSWVEYRPAVSFSHPVLLTDWAPVRDWLRRPESRKLLQLRTQLTRQAQLWKRTNCNREYLLHRTGFLAAHRLAASHGFELEPAERELFDQSGSYLAFLRQRNRIARGFGVLLVALLVAATIAALMADRASTDARVNLHRSLLKEADLHIASGNTPQAVLQALGAGPDLPDKAVQTLSMAFTGNRLIAMVQPPAPFPDGPRIPGFSSDGSHLATIVPGVGPRLWRLDKGRFVPERDLDAGGHAVHSLIIGDTDKAVFGIGDGGIWSLPAAHGESPTYPCGTRPGSVFTLDTTRRYFAIARNTAADSHGACVIDLATPGRVLFDRVLQEGEIRGLSFSPDSRALLTASAGGRTHLIDLDTGKLTLSLPEDGPLGRPFNNAVFDAAGDRIAIAAVDERVRLYKRDGKPSGELSESDIGGRRFKIHKSAVRDVAFSPDGRFLVAVDDEGQVVRWALDGSKQAVVLGKHGLSADEVEIIQPAGGESAAGETLVLTASLDQTARSWGLQTGKPVAVMGHDAAVSAARFSDTGERVFTFSKLDGSVRLWSITPISRLAFRLQHPDHVWNLDMASAPRELAPDGQALLLATAGFDGGVRVWRYRRGVDGGAPERVAEFQDHAGRVRKARFSPSARLLASAGFDGTAHVHNLVSGRACVLPVSSRSDGVEVYDVLFDPEERWLLTTSADAEQPVRLFSLDACAPIDVDPALREGDAPVGAAALHPGPGGILVATGDDNGILRVLHLVTGQAWKLLCALPIDDGPIGDVALSPDGRTVGVAGSESRVALVDVDEHGCRIDTDLHGHSGRVYSIAFSPDSQQVLTASLDKTARLWDRNGAPRAVLVGHEDRIYKASFSPGEGRWMLTASRDGSIRLWQRPDAKASGFRTLSTFLPLKADVGGVADAMFSPDGHYLAGAYWENAALLWRLWVEGDRIPQQLIDDWGEDRARLALIQDAYRFRQDNHVVNQESEEDQ